MSGVNPPGAQQPPIFDPGHQQYLRALDLQNGLPTYQPPKRDMLALLALGPGAAVLDVGSGAGDDTRALAAIVGATGRAVGLDLSDFLLAEARRRAEGAPGSPTFERGDVQDLAYADATFDACRCERVLQHVLDPARAIREMVRVTRPGGRVVVADSDWATSVCADPITQALWEHLARGVRNPTIGRQLGALLRESGLVGISVRPHFIGPIGADCDDAYIEVCTALVAVAVEQGALTAAQGAAWPDLFAASGRDGTGFALVPFFVAGGTKPA